MTNLILGLYPSIFIAFLGAYSYYIIDGVRAELHDDRYTFERIKSNSLWIRWYTKGATFSAISAISTVAIGGVISVAAVVNHKLGIFESLYSIIIILFFIYWLIQITFVSMTTMNKDCKKPLKAICRIIEAAPIIGFALIAIYIVKLVGVS